MSFKGREYEFSSSLLYAKAEGLEGSEQPTKKSSWGNRKYLRILSISNTKLSPLPQLFSLDTNFKSRSRTQVYEPWIIRRNVRNRHKNSNVQMIFWRLSQHSSMENRSFEDNILFAFKKYLINIGQCTQSGIALFCKMNGALLFRMLEFSLCGSSRFPLFDSAYSQICIDIQVVHVYDRFTSNISCSRRYEIWKKWKAVPYEIFLLVFT